jgi:Domain of unknown function (DUF1918)
MTGKVGDVIVVESERALQPARRGAIEEVLQEQPPRFRVRWEDGRTTIFSPSGGVARIEPRTQEPLGT